MAPRALSAALAVVCLVAPMLVAAQITASGQQCGGEGGACRQACATCTGGPCVDGSWNLTTCEAGTECIRINRYWWHCGREVDIASVGTLRWSEEFNGESIDESVWRFEMGDGSAYPLTGPGQAGWGNSESQCYTNSSSNSGIIPDPSSSNNRLLAITAVQSAGKPCINYNSYDGTSTLASSTDWTSAKMTTYGTNSFMYSSDGSPVYIEARLKVPMNQGTWPAVWLLPVEDTYGRWPQSGELDIMEHVSMDASFHFTMTFGSINRLTRDETAPTIDNPEDWHVFAMEWGPQYIAYLIDGQEYFRSNSSRWWSGGAPGVAGAPFNKPFYLILNLAIGGFGPSGGPPTEPGPFSLLIDYIRVWDIKPPSNQPRPPMPPPGLPRPPLPPSPPPRPPSPPVRVRNGQQCGGIGGNCREACSSCTGGHCTDGPWIGTDCENGTVCSMVNVYWWQCSPMNSSNTPPPLPPSSSPSPSPSSSPSPAHLPSPSPSPVYPPSSPLRSPTPQRSPSPSRSPSPRRKSPRSPKRKSPRRSPP